MIARKATFLLSTISLRRSSAALFLKLRSLPFFHHRALVLNFGDYGYRRMLYNCGLRNWRLTANLICHVYRWPRPDLVSTEDIMIVSRLLRTLFEEGIG